MLNVSPDSIQRARRVRDEGAPELVQAVEQGRQCVACGEHFNSTAAFDRHRFGDFGRERRCLTPAEMRARGMAVSVSGWWVTSPRENAVSSLYRDSRSACEAEADATLA